MEFPPPLVRHQEAIEQELRELLVDTGPRDLALYRMMQYQIGWLDRDGAPESSPPQLRLYGALCLEAGWSMGNEAGAEPAAAAVELLYHSIRVHEDMQLGDARMEGRPAAWWVWGPAQAINVGDALHAMAREGVFRLLQRGMAPEGVLAAVRELDASALRFYEGQFQELAFQERLDVTESQYLKMAEAKWGSLIGGAMALGAGVMGAGEAKVGALRRAGERLGVAVQFRDDMEELWGRATPGARTLSKSKLFPVVHLMEKGKLAQKRALGEVYFKRVMVPEDMGEVRRILGEAEAREYTEERLEMVKGEVLEALATVGLAPEAEARWREVVGSLTGR